MFHINYKGEIVYTSYNMLGERVEEIVSIPRFYELVRSGKDNVLKRFFEVYGLKDEQI